MTPDRWRAITEIFHAALARDAAARQAFLVDACKDDASLRPEVDALLAAHDDAGSFGAAPALVPALVQLAPGTPLGPYRIESLIGAGGMGEVYRATDTRFGRTVAIKSHIRSSPDLQARFEREARTIVYQSAWPSWWPRCTRSIPATSESLECSSKGRSSTGLVPVTTTLQVITNSW